MSTTTVLPFAGGELSSFDPQDNGCIEATSAGIYGTPYDPTFSRCAISCITGSAGFKSPVWAAASDFFFHGVEHYIQTAATSGFIQFLNGSTVVLQGSMASGGLLTFSTRQSGTLTTVGSVTLVAAGTAHLNTLDIRLVAGGSGSLTVYLAGTQIFSVTGLDHSGFAGVTQIQCQGTSGAATTTFWSQIICDTTAHIGDALVTLAEDTASAINTGWSGAVSGINEIVLDDSHSVTSSAAGDVSTYYKNAASLGTYNVVAVSIGARAQLTSGSSTNLQIALRTNGTNYFGPTTALDFGFQAVCASWTTNPFTAAAWDPVTAAAAEVGMKSIA